jgi:hypothetical protein
MPYARGLSAFVVPDRAWQFIRHLKLETRSSLVQVSWFVVMLCIMKVIKDEKHE